MKLYLTWVFFILGCLSSRWTPLGAAGFMEPVSRHHPKCTVRNSGEFLGSRIPRPRADLGPGLSSCSQHAGLQCSLRPEGRTPRQAPPLGAGGGGLPSLLGAGRSAVSEGLLLGCWGFREERGYSENFGSFVPPTPPGVSLPRMVQSWAESLVLRRWAVLVFLEYSLCWEEGGEGAGGSQAPGGLGAAPPS